MKNKLKVGKLYMWDAFPCKGHCESYHANDGRWIKMYPADIFLVLTEESPARRLKDGSIPYKILINGDKLGELFVALCGTPLWKEVLNE